MTEKGTFVRCVVSHGLFEGEYYVIVADASAYVAKRKVRVAKEPSKDEIQVSGDVQVFIIAGDPASNRALVELPGEPAAGGLRTWVSQEQLVSA